MRRTPLFIALFLITVAVTCAIVLRLDRQGAQRAGGASEQAGVRETLGEATGLAHASNKAGSKDGSQAPAKGAAASSDPVATSQGQAAGAVKKTAGSLSKDEILARIRAGEPGMEVLASRLPVQKVAVTPQWEKGDEWLVETWYRQMQKPREDWSGPARWRFRIKREVSFREQACYEVLVDRVDDRSWPVSVFYITRDSYQLAGMETTVVQKGQRRRVTHIPGRSERHRGVEAMLSIVPFDLPAAGLQGSLSPAGKSALPPFVNAGRKQAKMPSDKELVGGKDRNIDLSYQSPFDKTTVRQRWSEHDMRWPVMSRTETTWSFRRGK